MPADDFNDPYARKQAILRGLGLDTGGRAPEGLSNAQLVTVPVPRTRVEASLAVRGDRALIAHIYLAHGDMDAALAVHGAAYVRYLATAWDRWCRTPPKPVPVFPEALPGIRSARKPSTTASAGGAAAFPRSCLPTSSTARTGTRGRAWTCTRRRAGTTPTETRPCLRMMAPSLAGDMRVVAAIVASMETELRRGLQNDENAYYYALMSHPGHHAGFSNAGGTAT